MRFGLVSACQRSQIANLQSGFLYDKKSEKSRRSRLWMASFFKFIAANLSLTQAVTAGNSRYKYRDAPCLARLHRASGGRETFGHWQENLRAAFADH